MQLVLLPVLWYVNEFGNSFIRHIVFDTDYYKGNSSHPSNLFHLPTVKKLASIPQTA